MGSGGEPRKSEEKASRRLAMLGGLAGLVALLASLIEGPPDKVPDIALGWTVILYAERVAFAILVVVGIGGVLYRLKEGDQVSSAGGGPAQVAVDQATKPTEVLKEGVDAGVSELNERLYRVEKKLEERYGE